MKKTFIKDIREKDQVTGSFLVTRKESGISKSGKPYLNIKLMDSTGELEARVWEDAEELGKRFQKNDVVSIKGFAVAYQGGIQVNVTSINAVADGEYDIRDFLPSSRKDPKVMLEELDNIISGIKDTSLKGLLSSIFKDQGIRGLFSLAPAAKSMHHPYLGGLLEHTLSICGLAEKITGHYKKGINKDLLLAGAILHDIGKIHELSYSRSFDYTDEGRLLGHITMGIELVDNKIRDLPGFPEKTAVLLKHMLLSHHGQLEFGSPKRPKTIEAIILSYLDDLDAKVSTVQALAENEREKDSSWTSYQKLFERYIYKGGVPSETKTDNREEDKNGQGPLTLF